MPGTLNNLYCVVEAALPRSQCNLPLCPRLIAARLVCRTTTTHHTYDDISIYEPLKLMAFIFIVITIKSTSIILAIYVIDYI